MREPPTFWWRWLLAAATGVGVFGLACVLLPDAVQAFFNMLMFGRTWLPPEYGTAVVPYLVFVTGVLGAVMLGWAVLMLLARVGPFRRGDVEGWRMLAWPLAIWFVVDTTWSVATGFWQNAILNCAFGLAFAIPLAATWRHFHRR